LRKNIQLNKPATSDKTPAPTPIRITIAIPNICPAISDSFSGTGITADVMAPDITIKKPNAKPKNAKANNMNPTTLVFFLYFGAVAAVTVPAVLQALQSNHISVCFDAKIEFLRGLISSFYTYFLAKAQLILRGTLHIR
jgi:hypothetical protein